MVVTAIWDIILTWIISIHSSDLSWSRCHFFSEVWPGPSPLTQYTVRCHPLHPTTGTLHLPFSQHLAHAGLPFLFHFPISLPEVRDCMLFTISDTEGFNDYLLKKKKLKNMELAFPSGGSKEDFSPSSWTRLLWVPYSSWRPLAHTHAHTQTPHLLRLLFYPPACLVTKRFLNHFAPSFCNILQQIKHPLLGMFSICFMLILIKESETEQTVPSRWPYKCEISKLFYLPQTLLVNFFKLIQASERLLILRRKLSNPRLQIFAFVTTPRAND